MSPVTKMYRMKNLYCIRNQINFSNDSCIKNINKLKTNWRDHKYIELVIASNIPESIKTANIIFPNKSLIIQDLKFDSSKDFYKILEKRDEVNIAFITNNKLLNILCNNDSNLQTNFKRCHPLLLELVFMNNNICDN